MSQLPQDVEEFIAENAYIHAAPVETIGPETIRAWMAGHVRVPVEPAITSDMKAECMGEFFVRFPEWCRGCGVDGSDECGVCHGKGEFMRQINVPWIVMKEIYRSMYKSALNASKGESSPDLWCVHILGPDDLHAAPSRAYAEVAADLHNRRFADLSAKLDVVCKAVAAPWPYSRESHAEDVASFIDDWFMPEPIVSRANASKGE